MHWAAITAISLAGYIVLSASIVRLLPFRSSEARKRKQEAMVGFPVRRVAHRGGSLLGQENTLYTFAKGVEVANVEMLELDVGESKDGVVIVAHDLKLDRLCGLDVEVRDLIVGGVQESKKEELPLLADVVPLHFPSKEKSAYTRDHEPQRLCTLREVFTAFPNTPMHVDLKLPGSDQMVPKVVEMIEEFKRERITILGAGGRKNELQMYKELSKPARKEPTHQKNGSLNEQLVSAKTRKDLIPTFGSFRQIIVVYLLYYVGLLPFYPLQFDVMSIPMPTESKRSMFKRFLDSSWKASLFCWLLHTPSMWDHMRRRGVTVLGWVCNDEDELVEVSQWPVDGIMTDDPILLDTFYNKNPHLGAAILSSPVSPKAAL